MVQGDNPRLGTLFLASDLRPIYARLRLYGGIALLIALRRSSPLASR